MEGYDNDLVPFLLFLAHLNEIDLDVADELDWFSFNFGASIVYTLRLFMGLGCFPIRFQWIISLTETSCTTMK